MIEKIIKLRNKAISYLLGDTFVDKSIKEKRVSICNKCDQLNSDRSCKICKCFIDVKAEMKTNINPITLKYEITHCPQGKWDDAEIAEYFLTHK